MFIAILFVGFRQYRIFSGHKIMSNCNCGDSGTGKYFGKVAGQVGDRLEAYGTGLISTAQKRFKSWTGLGDYDIQYNSLITGRGGMNNLHVSSQGRGTTIRYREYLGDIAVHPTVVGQFNVRKFEVNPANVLTFPWLAAIAVQYDQYIPQGIIFEFRTTTTDATTNSAIGSVICSTQYDVDEVDPSSKGGMLNTAYSSEAKMSEDLVHGVECEPTELANNLYYTRIVGAAQRGDIADYDLCNTYFATQGGSLLAGTIIGSVYVHYEFTFLKEIPRGGLSRKDKIYSGWGPVSKPVLGTSIDFGVFGDVSFTSGVDMGLTFTSTTITIPKKWAGASIQISVFAFIPSTVTAGVNGVTLTNCTKLELNMPKVNAEATWHAPSVAGDAADQSYFVYNVKLDNVMGEDAVLTTAGFGRMPSVTVDPAFFSLAVEIVPQAFLVSLTN